ncbi:unnamed protein product, partial [Symbiodinium microadriaticum]
MHLRVRFLKLGNNGPADGCKAPVAARGYPANNGIAEVDISIPILAMALVQQRPGSVALLALLLTLWHFQAFILPPPRRETAVARQAQGEADGPVGDWVECEISYTPTISMHSSVQEPRRSDIYVFHKRQLQEDFGHLYAKLGFTVQEGVMYKDIKTVCREPDDLNGDCSDCFKFMFGGAIGFVGTTSPKFYNRQEVSVQ